MRRRQFAGLLIGILAAVRLTAKAQDVVTNCTSPSTEVAQVTDRGWAALRASRLDDADAQFRAALARCPRYASPIVGAAYVAMRRGNNAEAATLFNRALTVQPSNYDALIGLGMLAYRRGDLSTSWRRFAAALAAVPGDSLSLWYLDRIPQALDSLVLPTRPRPPTMKVAARTGVRVCDARFRCGNWSAVPGIKTDQGGSQC